MFSFESKQTFFRLRIQFICGTWKNMCFCNTYKKNLNNMIFVNDERLPLRTNNEPVLTVNFQTPFLSCNECVKWQDKWYG